MQFYCESLISYKDIEQINILFTEQLGHNIIYITIQLCK